MDTEENIVTCSDASTAKNHDSTNGEAVVGERNLEAPGLGHEDKENSDTGTTSTVQATLSTSTTEKGGGLPSMNILNFSSLTETKTTKKQEDAILEVAEQTTAYNLQVCSNSPVTVEATSSALEPGQGSGSMIVIEQPDQVIIQEKTTVTDSSGVQIGNNNVVGSALTDNSQVSALVGATSAVVSQPQLVIRKPGTVLLYRRNDIDGCDQVQVGDNNIMGKLIPQEDKFVKTCIKLGINPKQKEDIFERLGHEEIRQQFATMMAEKCSVHCELKNAGDGCILLELEVPTEEDRLQLLRMARDGTFQQVLLETFLPEFAAEGRAVNMNLAIGVRNPSQAMVEELQGATASSDHEDVRVVDIPHPLLSSKQPQPHSAEAEGGASNYPGNTAEGSTKEVLDEELLDNQDVPASKTPFKHLSDSEDSEDSTSQDGATASVEEEMLLGEAAANVPEEEFDVNFLTCDICQNIFHNPRVLPCHHTFCARCLKRWCKRKSQFTCPTCRQQVTLPGADVTSLPPDFRVNKMLDFRAQQSSEKAGMQCQMCDSGTRVAASCRDCHFFLCQNCITAHSKTPALKSHHITMLEYCTQHTDQLMTFYCQPCAKLVCQDCTVTEHPKGPDHNPQEISNIQQTSADLPTEEQVDLIKFGKLIRLLCRLGMTEDETDEMDEKDEARAELKRRIRDRQATAATRRRAGQILKEAAGPTMTTPRASALLALVKEEINKMSMKTILGILAELGVDTDNIESKESARMILKSKIGEKAGTSRHPAQSAEKLRAASEAYRENQGRLAGLCNSIAVFLPSLDISIKAKLKLWFGCETEEVIADVQRQLQKREVPVLVAGETSSGKSTFLNMLLGENILPVAYMGCTSTICEVKYGETRQAVVHLQQPNDQGERQITMSLDKPEDHQKLEQYIFLQGASRDRLPLAAKIEIFLPLRLLQGGSVLVDSPPVGENPTMDKMVADYLLESGSFIYIIDSSRAGGVHPDRLGQILKLCADKNTENVDPKSAIFICNKWDLVPTDQRDEVRSETFRKLSGMWPGLEESQVFYVSTTQAGQLRGILSDDLSKALDGIDMLLAQSFNMNLKSQYRKLSALLNKVENHVALRLNFNTSPDEDVKLKDEMKSYLLPFEDQMEKNIKELERMVRICKAETLASLQKVVRAGNLWHFLSDPKEEPLATLVQKKKTRSRSSDLSSLEDLCEYTVCHLYSNCSCSSSYSDHIASMNGNYQKLMSTTLAMLSSAQREMMAIFGVSKPAEMEVVGVKYEQQAWMMHAVQNYMKITPSTFDLIGQNTKLHITAPGLKEHLRQAPPNTPLVEILKEVLSSRDLLSEIAEKQVQPLLDVLETFESDVAKMKIIVDETIEDMFNDQRDEAEIADAYSAVRQQTYILLGQLAMFYLTYIRVYEYELDNIRGWTDTRNRLGGGSFGEVFKVQVMYKGRETPAALKLGLYPYDVITEQTATDFLTEEDNLRKLKESVDATSDQQMMNQHIVEYYGTACKRLWGGNLRLGLVMELCEGTLEDRIIGNRDHNPAWWDSNPEKQRAAFSYTQNLAVQLCEGLKHIHDAGYIHRDLKLINILVTNDDVVKLAGFGQTKQEVRITGTMAGTPIYAAPEVKERKVYDRTADIYSLGLILWEMWYGTTLYLHRDAAYARQMEDYLKKGKDIRMPHWPGTVPPIPEWTRLIHDCLKKDPRERPKIQECLDRISAMQVE